MRCEQVKFLKTAIWFEVSWSFRPLVFWSEAQPREAYFFARAENSLKAVHLDTKAIREVVKLPPKVRGGQFAPPHFRPPANQATGGSDSWSG